MKRYGSDRLQVCWKDRKSNPFSGGSISAQAAIFSFEASPQIGSGHAVRSLTLAKELETLGWEVFVATRPTTLRCLPASYAVRENQLILCEDLNCQLAVLEQKLSAKESWLVVDNYDIGQEFEASCRRWTKGLMVITDLYDQIHDCDILLNQNFGCVPVDYEGLVPDRCAVLVGTDFTLLRPEFNQARLDSVGKNADANNPMRILVCFGGSDPQDMTRRVVAALSDSSIGAQLDIVISSGYAGTGALIDAVEKSPLVCNLYRDPPNLADLMATAHLGIGAAGSMTWERCCVGLPSLVFVLAENQYTTARRLHEMEALIFVDHKQPEWTAQLKQETSRLLSDRSTRDDYRRRSLTICDGKGATRVAEFLCRYDQEINRTFN